jgi:hypothetical protein
VNSVNDAPSGVDREVINPHGQAYFFGRNDDRTNVFQWSDNNDTPANTIK